VSRGASFPPPREPIFNVPAAVMATLAVLVLIHALRDFVLDPETDALIILDGAVIPARWAQAYGGVSAERIREALLAAGDGTGLALLPFALGRGGKPWTGLTYALLHGSWAHVLVNSVWLAAFGTPVARRCGAARYLVLFLVAALAGAIAHVLLHPYQAVPMIGASAGVSGLMAAAAWFMFAPPVFLPEGVPAEVHERPREKVALILRNRRVLIFLAVWFGTNYLFAMLAGPLGVTDASIAWEAHVGGFLAGFLLFPLLDPRHPRSSRPTA
jgi:membrane associated rhomboid family serine protease